MSGLADKILASADLAHEDVAVKEWGCTVRIQEMDAAERIDFEAECDQVKEANGGKLGELDKLTRYLRRTLRDPADGTLLFNEAKFEAFLKKSPKIVVRLCNVAARLSATDDAAKEAVSRFSDAAPSGASPTA